MGLKGVPDNKNWSTERLSQNQIQGLILYKGGTSYVRRSDWLRLHDIHTN
jgi:hypothetical protein